MPRDWTEIADGVRVCHALRYTTASTVINDGTAALLVDPALSPEELSALAADVVAAGVPVVAGVSTHPHWDHLLWPAGLPAVARWAAAAAVDAALAHDAELRAQGGVAAVASGAEFGRIRPVPDSAAGAVVAVPWAGPEALLVVHDGHAPGHAALWLPAPRVLLAGDMLSDVEPPLPESPDNLPAYHAGLESLRPFVERAAVLVPGHGSPTHRPMDRWVADRRYLDAVLAGRLPDDPRVTPDE